MKRKLSIALALALMALLVFSSTALAWDVEDPCVADNEDFIGGWGFPGCWPEHYKSGAQEPWYPGRPPNEGLNLYRDDVTDTGNLDIVAILTFTPDEIGLPIMGEYPGEPIPALTFWKMGAASPDTWYWALEPRGYNHRVDDNNYLRIVLPDAKENFLRRGTLRYGDIDFDDGTWRIQIPATLQIWNDNGAGGAAEKIIVDNSGNILSDLRLAGQGEIVVTKVCPKC